MADAEPTASNAPTPALRGRFSPVEIMLGLPGAVGLGAVAAWLAVEAQFYFSPLILFPILVGVGLGATVVGLVRMIEIGHRPTVILATVSAALVAIVGQHYVSYRVALREHKEDAETVGLARDAFPELLRGRLVEPPANLGEFLRQEAARGRPLFRGYVATGTMAWLSWAVDALLLLAASSAMVMLAIRQPYCSRCRSWYRTIRVGRVSVSTAGRLAECAGVTIAAEPKWTRYRLSGCRGGCGPTRLELSWEETTGELFVATAWLDPDRRRGVAQALDEASD